MPQAQQEKKTGKQGPLPPPQGRIQPVPKQVPKQPLPPQAGPWSSWIPEDNGRWFYKARLQSNGQWEYAFTEGYRTTSRKGSPYTVFEAEAQYNPTTQAMLLPAAPPAAMPMGNTAVQAQVYQPLGMRQVQPPPGTAAPARPYQPAVDAVESSEDEDDEDDEADAAPQVAPKTADQRPSHTRPQQSGSSVSKAKHSSPKAVGAKMRAEKGLQFNSKKKVQGWLSDIGERE